MTEDQLIEALNKFHGDTSRSPELTLEGLERLREELEPMIDGLRMTIQMDED